MANRSVGPKFSLLFTSSFRQRQERPTGGPFCVHEPNGRAAGCSSDSSPLWLTTVDAIAEWLFLESHWAAGILKPSSAPRASSRICIWDNTDKGKEVFSKIKDLLRKAEARTREALVDAIGTGISMVTPEDARGFFEHCGYTTPVRLL